MRKTIENLDDKLKEGKRFKLQGMISFRGLDIAVENRKGSVRRGVDDDGSDWETKMFYPYGYIRGTIGADGDGIDVYIGKNKDSEKVYIINQENPETGKFDEQKVMLGFDSEDAARDAYLAHYDDQKFLGKIISMSFEEFKMKIEEAKPKKKPVILKAFGSILKAFGEQFGLFGGGGDTDVFEGETRIKDGKVYQIKRSEKNPNVRRLFRTDQPQQSTTKPIKTEKKDTQELTLFGQNVSVKKPKTDREKRKRMLIDKYGVLIDDFEDNDLFSQPKDEKPKEGDRKPKEEKQPKQETKKPDKFGAEDIEKRNKAKREEVNQRVKELLANKKDEEMTPEDIELLALYSGKGGIKGETLGDISLNEFYTRKDVAEFMWSKLHDLGFKGGNALEPSMGTGVFVHTAPDDTLITGVEYDETSGRIGNILHGQEHDIHVKSFEEFVQGYDNFSADLEGGEYDAVVGNCPFGDRAETVIYDKEMIHHKKHELYFVDRGLDMLRPGGLMSMVVPTGVMDNQINDFRLEINKKAEFLGAIRMPTGAFKHADAQVTTDIVFFRKRPPEVINYLKNLPIEDLRKLYDEKILDADFIAGKFFENNPEFAIGEETFGQFGMKIWKGDLKAEDLARVGELLKPDSDDYNQLGIDFSKFEDFEKELHVGDLKTINGKTYRLNENHRWERVNDEDLEDVAIPQELKDMGIKNYADYLAKQQDTAFLYTLNREHLKLIGNNDLINELANYTGKNEFQEEYLRKAVVLGLAVKKFKIDMQDGKMDSATAHAQAEKLKALLSDYYSKYGHPVDNLQLNKLFRRSDLNSLVHLSGAFQKDGQPIKLFDNPSSYYKVYNVSHEIGGVDRTDIGSVVQHLFVNNYPLDLDTIKSEYEGEGDVELALLESDKVYIDENGDYKPKEDVLFGEIFHRIDEWEKEREEIANKLKDDKEPLSDSMRALLQKRDTKLEGQIIEAKDRANIKELQHLPILMGDAGKIFDIKVLNDYLSTKLGAQFSGNVIRDKDTDFLIPEDPTLARLYLGWAEITKEGKDDVKKTIRQLFNKDENPIMFMMINKLNGLGIPPLRTPDGQAKKAQIGEIEKEFKDYLLGLDEADAIADKYNRMFNCYIQKNYDTSPILGLKKFAYDRVITKDKDGNDIKAVDKAGDHTWATVRRMAEQGKGLIAHGVGLGKTLEGIILMLLGKETGEVEKPVIVTPKSVLMNWAREIDKWTEGVNYLIIGYSKKDESKGWTPENTVEDGRAEKLLKLQRAAAEDFDMVLTSRDTFGQIDFSPETKKKMLDELISKYYPEGNNLSSITDKESKYYKKVKKKRDKLIQHLSESMILKDPFEGVYIDNIGFDCLMVDEAHSLKNLLQPLESEISGVNATTAQRSMHNFFASKIIRGQNNERGFYALTATPISNSPLEVFNMMLPFAEKELEKLNVKNMDEFITRFAEIDTAPTTNADGRVVSKLKFVGWKSSAALRNVFFRLVDYKTKDDVESVKASIKFPREKANNLVSVQNAGQRTIIQHCRLRLWMLNSRVYDKDTGSLVFSAEKLMEKVKEGLISQEEADKVEQYYYNDYLPKFQKLNQHTPPDEQPIDDHFFKIQQDLIKATSDLAWYKSDSSDFSKPVNDEFVEKHKEIEKFKQLTQNAKSIHESGGKQIIFAINTSLHDKIKADLVKAGVPENEIIIVNGKTAGDSSKRVAISDSYNQGKYKVVIGNYSTMGEGLNFNYMTSDIHHLQPAWNYLQIDQGNGRGIRQGNPLDFVNTHYYLTKGSIDGFMNTKIMDKGGMVDKFLKGETSRWDDDVQLDADEMMIELADNPEQAKALLAFRNKRLNEAIKVQEREAGFKNLEKLYDVKRRMNAAKDKTTKQYQMLEQEHEQLKNKLIANSNFEHKEKMTLDNTPIILPKLNKVIPVGTVMQTEGGNDNGYYVITDFTPSTGRVSLAKYDTKSEEGIMRYGMHIKDFESGVGKIFSETEHDLGSMFTQLISREGKVGCGLVSNLPVEFLKANKKDILKNYEGSEPIMYKDNNGDIKISDYRDAKEAIANEGGRYVFPQEILSFPKVLYDLILDKMQRGKNGSPRNSYYEYTDYVGYARKLYGSDWEKQIKKEVRKLNGDKGTSIKIPTEGTEFMKRAFELKQAGHLSESDYNRIVRGNSWSIKYNYAQALRKEFLTKYGITYKLNQYGDDYVNGIPNEVTQDMLDEAEAIDDVYELSAGKNLRDLLTKEKAA